MNKHKQSKIFLDLFYFFVKMKNNNQLDKQEEIWYKDALLMFSRLSIWVALPVIAASFLGKWLDNKFATKPWLVTICVIIAFNITIIVLIKETGKVFKNISNSKSKTKE